jgi:hypothetical protein
VGTRLAQAFCGDLAVIAAEESSAVACRQLVPHPRPDRRPFRPIPPVDGATGYASAVIDTIKPNRIASLRTQTVTGKEASDTTQ